MSLLGPVAALTWVAMKLAADRGFVSVHRSGNVVLVILGFEENGNFVSFVLGEMCVVHSRQLRLGGQGARMLSHLAHPAR